MWLTRLINKRAIINWWRMKNSHCSIILVDLYSVILKFISQSLTHGLIPLRTICGSKAGKVLPVISLQLWDLSEQAWFVFTISFILPMRWKWAFFLYRLQIVLKFSYSLQWHVLIDINGQVVVLMTNAVL